MMAIKKVKGNKLSALVYRNGLPLVCTISLASTHDSQLYEPTLEAFTIPEVQERLVTISTDAAYDARKFVSTAGNEESRATFRLTGDLQGEEGLSGSI